MNTPPDEDLGDPHVGRLGESPEDFERRRIRYFDREADRLNERQADIPLRDLDRDPPREGESYDTPEMTQSAIARMAAARGKQVRVHGPTQEQLHTPARGGLVLTSDPPVSPPRLSVPEVFSQNAKQEMGLMVQAVVGELSRELRATFADLKEDIEANTRLLGVMNAPMEAITDSHERASSSFETLRREIAEIGGAGSSPALEKLARVVDTAGLGKAQSRAETRFEQLAEMIEERFKALEKVHVAAMKGVTAEMVKVLHELERLNARALADAMRRAGP